MEKCHEKTHANDLPCTEKSRIRNPSRFTKVARMSCRYKETNGFLMNLPFVLKKIFKPTFKIKEGVVGGT